MNTQPSEDPEAGRRHAAAAHFESNKSISALVRDGELEIASKGPPPVDLRTIPKDQWDRYANHDLTLPPMIARYLAGREPAPIEAGEEESLVNAVMRYHDVQPPWDVDMTGAMRRLGRAWEYAPEAAPMLTGFLLIKEEA